MLQDIGGSPFLLTFLVVPPRYVTFLFQTVGSHGVSSTPVRNAESSSREPITFSFSAVFELLQWVEVAAACLRLLLPFPVFSKNEAFKMRVPPSGFCLFGTLLLLPHPSRGRRTPRLFGGAPDSPSVPSVNIDLPFFYRSSPTPDTGAELLFIPDVPLELLIVP